MSKGKIGVHTLLNARKHPFAKSFFAIGEGASISLPALAKVLIICYLLNSQFESLAKMCR